jgi:hypothetical protein
LIVNIGKQLPVFNYNDCHDANGRFCRAGSGKAAAASRAAKKAGTKQAHKAAVAEHKAAAKYHRDEGNDDVADLHESAVKFHSGQAKISSAAKAGTKPEKKPAPSTKAAKKKTTKKLTTNNLGEPMTKTERTTLIDTLITNGCGCWTEEDRGILRAFEPDRLRKLVANSVQSAEMESTLNTLKIKLGVEEFTEELINNMSVKAVDDDDDDDDDDEEDTTEEIVTTNCGGDMEPDDDETEMKTKKKKKGPPTMNAQEWLADTPAEIRQAVEAAVQIEKEAKQELVRKLTANTSGDKQALTNLFMSKSLSELKLLAGALPTTQTKTNTFTTNQSQDNQTNRLSLSFFGGQSTSNLTNNMISQDADEFDKDDILPLPKLTFGKN